jgi:2-polyprenyl-3-methyl-5-hydroxy-6-metoxy-1,4-benzoquinol methylase
MRPHATALLEQARRQLAAGDRDGAAVSLAAVLEFEPACLPAHNLREQHRLAGNFSDWTGVDASISPDDDIFRFFATHPDSRNPLRDYIADGWRTLCELQRVLDRVGKNLYRCPSFLEFACGHGRFTRHLANALAPGTLTVSDVVPGCVEFLRQRWAVKGFDSSFDPDALRAPDRYDVVFVLSLFSHLPESTWQAWLRTLYGAVAPGGVLVLTTHGELAARKSGVDLGARGFAFFAASESQTLEAHAYGTAFAAADYVGKAIALSTAPAAVLHLPAAFWSYQDAWILVRP